MRIALVLLALLATSIPCFGASEGVTTGNVALALKCPRPRYPYEARTRRITGSGIFVCRIDIKTGHVKKVIIAKSTGSPVLDNAAVEALQRWEFQPGKLKPISQIL